MELALQQRPQSASVARFAKAWHAKASSKREEATPQSASVVRLAKAWKAKASSKKEEVQVGLRERASSTSKQIRESSQALQNIELSRPRSAPTFRPQSGARRSGLPLKAKQSLVTVDIYNRFWYREIVDQNGNISTLSGGKLGLTASERGLEYDHFGLEKPAPEALPSLQDVMGLVCKEFDMNTRHLASKQPQPEKVPKRRKQAAARQVDSREASLSTSFASTERSTPSRSFERNSLETAYDADTSTASAGWRKQQSTQNGRGGDRANRRGKTLRDSQQGLPESTQQQPVARAPEDAASSQKLLELSKAHSLSKTAEHISTAKEAMRTAAHNMSHSHSRELMQAAGAVLESRLIPWDLVQLHKAFYAFGDPVSHEVFLDDLGKVLKHLGIRPEESQVTSIAKKQTPYGSFDFDEFKDFLRSYRKWEIIELQRLFRETDTDANGAVDLHELFQMVHKAGYHTTWNTMLEIHLAFGRGRNSHVTYEEFEQVLHHLRSTSGIAGHELEELRDAFSRVTSTSEAKELSAEDIWRILIYQSYPIEQEEVRRLIAEVDENGNGVLNFYEFLKLVRMYCDKEHGDVARLVQDHSRIEDGDEAAIALADLGIALGDLGYHVSHTALWETVDSLGELENEDCLSVEEMTIFLRTHRRKEGFTKKEINALKVAFQKGGGADEFGHVSVLGLGQSLRWLGFAMTLQARQRAVYEVDLDANGMLEFHEFLKLMRRLHHQETANRRDVFMRYVPNAKGRLPILRLGEVLKQLNGSGPEAQRLTVALKKLDDRRLNDSNTSDLDRDAIRETLDIHEFDNLCEIYRRLDVTAARKNAGYTSKEVEALRRSFQRYDIDGSGQIERSELRKFLQDAFPEMTRSLQRQRSLQALLKKVDKDGNGQLDFEEFLWLMRESDDARDAAEVALEASVLPEVGLSAEEAEGFREIFCECADANGEAALKDVMSLLKFADFSSEQADGIARLVEEVKPAGHKGIRFPEFLRLLQRLYEDRSLGVQQAVLRVAGQQEQVPARQKRVRLRSQASLGSLPDTESNSSQIERRQSAVSSFLDATRRQSQAAVAAELSPKRGSFGSRSSLIRASVAAGADSMDATVGPSSIATGRKSVAASKASCMYGKGYSHMWHSCSIHA